MSYESKIIDLTNAIREHVLFEDVEQATAWIASATAPVTDDIPLAIQHMAVRFFHAAERFGIEEIIGRIGACEGTRLSALREAIRACAADYIREHDKREQEADEALLREIAAVAV